MKTANEFEARELAYVLRCLRNGDVERLLVELDKGSGLVEVAVDALTSPGGSSEKAVAAVISFVEIR